MHDETHLRKTQLAQSPPHHAWTLWTITELYGTNNGHSVLTLRNQPRGLINKPASLHTLHPKRIIEQLRNDAGGQTRTRSPSLPHYWIYNCLKTETLARHLPIVLPQLHTPCPCLFARMILKRHWLASKQTKAISHRTCHITCPSNPRTKRTSQ